MPASGTQFNDQQITELRDYVLQLANQNGGESPEVTEPDRWSAVGFSGFTSLRNAPRLAVERTDGTEVELADFSGKIVLVNFWGTTCVHCLSEMPNLKSLADELADQGLVVLSVCADESDATLVSETAFEFAPGIDVFFDVTGLAAQRYEVQALPTFWLIDRHGQALARRTGAVDWTSPEIKSLIVELLDED
jgi:thiol-disulfide isomerase/thioredoxin